MSKCNCYDERMELIKSKIMQSVPDDATEVDIRWEGYSYFMSGDYNPVNAGVKIEYRGIKKNGTPKANLTKQTSFLTFDYCPFCGRKLGKSGE